MFRSCVEYNCCMVSPETMKKFLPKYREPKKKEIERAVYLAAAYEIGYHLFSSVRKFALRILRRK